MMPKTACLAITRLLRAFLLAVILSACASPSAVPPTLPAAPSPQPPTATVQPTSTFSPTPTFTLAPSATPTLRPTPTQPAETTLLFSGIIVPARCVQAAIDANGNPDYPYEEVRDLIRSADLAVGTLNASISDFPPHTGCVRTLVLVGSANNADAIARAGFDVMSVATNHIKNCGITTCGDRAFLDTLDNLRRVGIQPVGAGRNHAEAMQPVVVTLNGVRFGIVSLGHIEPMAFAGPDTPGIAVLNSENLKAAIQAARQVSDVVIAMPHFGPEDTAEPTWIQRGLAEELVQAGADLVIGNHTHVIQGYQQIQGVWVFYGLGNFIFDQDLNDHQQSILLRVTFKGKQLTGYERIPVHVDEDGRAHLAGETEAAEILEQMDHASRGLR